MPDNQDKPEEAALVPAGLRRDARGRLLPGSSGGLNPGGRPKFPAELRDQLRAATPKAIEALIKLLDSKSPTIRLKAIEVLFDRAYGKPAQALTGPEGEGPVQVAAMVILPAAVEPEDE